MSDRVAVFNKGVEQVGTPQEIYDESATEFVCNFIGDSSTAEPGVVVELDHPARHALTLRQLLPAGRNGVLRQGARPAGG